MTDILPWVATVATVTAAFMTASNLGSRITGYGFVVFTLGSLCWLAIGLTTQQPALLWTNVVLTVLNLFGIWRWLGRQARVDKGTEAAAEASEASPEETLFPISLLTKAPVEGKDGPLGACVDAMAGRGSGRIVYVGISSGGVAGVGETLYRVPWHGVRMDDGTLRIGLSREQLERAEQIERDEWPAR